MGQVFGAIDERKDAAERLQRLRQTRSVTDYITDFQVITSSLDWDEEALEDKFLEGLKQEVRRALIYYPQEPKNLEELFERAQRIDREIWGQQMESGKRGNHNNPRNRFTNKQQEYRTDRDGDIVMKGAKVNMEKAKREGLCYNCELPGHQARNCRKKKSNLEKQPVTKIRMVRSGLVINQGRGEPETKNLNETSQEPTALTQAMEGLTLDNFATDSSSDESNELASSEERIKKWANDVTTSTPREALVRGYRGRHQPMGRSMRKRNTRTSEIPGGQPDEWGRCERIQAEPIVPKEEEQQCHQNLRNASESTRRHRPMEADRSPKIIETSLARVEFDSLRRMNRPGWRDFCREYDPKTTEIENDLCTCYGFYQKCWADSEERWVPHIQHCEPCEEWVNRRCNIPGHSTKAKSAYYPT